MLVRRQRASGPAAARHRPGWPGHLVVGSDHALALLLLAAGCERLGLKEVSDSAA